MTLFGKTLLLLNLIAAALFALLAIHDYSKRQAWTDAVHKQEVAIEGQPIEDQQKELRALKDRKGNNSFFAAVNGAAKKYASEVSGKKEALETMLYPLAANWDQLQQYQKKTPSEKLIEDAAKRWMLAQVLLPLEEFSVQPGVAGERLANRERLGEKIGDLEFPYDKLEKILIERIDDLLRPQDEHPTGKGKKDDSGGLILDLIATEKPGETVSYQLRYQRLPQEQKVKLRFEAAGEGSSKSPGVSPSQVAIKLANVEGQPKIDLTSDGTGFAKTDNAFKTDHVLRGEISFTANAKQYYAWFAERESVDYRQALAFMLFSLAEVANPQGKLLETPSEKRVEELVGRKMLPHAIDMQTKAFDQIMERRLVEINHDFDYFVERYHMLVKERLPYFRDFIAHQNGELTRVRKNLAARQKHLESREEYVKEVEKKVQAERKKATAALAELARWQQRLFAVQKQGSGVAEENQRLERKIRKLETGRLGRQAP